MEPVSTDAIAGIYAGSIVSNFDIHKADKLNEIFRRYGDQGMPDYFTMLKAMGWESSVAQDEYGNYEENRYHVRFKTSTATTANAPGADVDLTLHADSVDANNRFYPRKNQHVLFPNEVVAYIADIDTTTPASPVLTLRPLDGAAIPDTVDGTQLVISSNAWTEGSGQPKAALSGVIYEENVAQIIKETIGQTGSEMTRQTWVRINNMEGAPYYFKGQAEIDYRMAVQIDGALIFGRKTTNPNAVDEEGNPYKTTEGLIPYMRRKSFNQVTAADTFPVATFNAIDKQMERNHAGNYVLGMLGIDRHQALEDSLVTYFNNTDINYTRKVVNQDIFDSNESLAATVNFKLLTKSERTFCFKRFKSFNHPELYGASGYDFSQYGMFIPLNKRRDPKTGNPVESIGMRYRAHGNYNRRTEVWQVNGAGPGLKVTEFDKNNTFQRAHIGAHFRGGEQMVLMTPS